MDMMLDAAGDPAVGIVDPKGVWPICSGHLPLSGDRAAALSRDALLDLEQVEFQCPLSGGGLAIKKLTARCFDASSNITNVTAAYSGEPGLWWRRPLGYIFLAAGDSEDIDAYRTSIRPELLAWANTMAESKFEWLVVFVVLGQRGGSLTGAAAGGGGAGLEVQGTSRVLRKMQEDLRAKLPSSASGGMFERFVELAVVADPEANRLRVLRAMQHTVKNCLQSRVRRFGDELRQLDAKRGGGDAPDGGRSTGAWDFPSVFATKEALALLYEHVSLPHEALRQYRELAAFGQFARSEGPDDVLAALRALGEGSRSAPEHVRPFRRRLNAGDVGALELAQHILMREARILRALGRGAEAADRVGEFVQSHYAKLLSTRYASPRASEPREEGGAAPTDERAADIVAMGAALEVWAHVLCIDAAATCEREAPEACDESTRAVARRPAAAGADAPVADYSEPTPESTDEPAHTSATALVQADPAVVSRAVGALLRMARAHLVRLALAYAPWLSASTLWRAADRLRRPTAAETWMPMSHGGDELPAPLPPPSSVAADVLQSMRPVFHMGDDACRNDTMRLTSTMASVCNFEAAYVALTRRVIKHSNLAHQPGFFARSCFELAEFMLEQRDHAAAREMLSHALRQFPPQGSGLPGAGWRSIRRALLHRKARCDHFCGDARAYVSTVVSLLDESVGDSDDVELAQCYERDMRRMNTQGALEGEPLCVDVGNLLSIDSIEPDAPAGERRAMRVMNGVDGQVRACRCGVSKIMQLTFSLTSRFREPISIDSARLIMRDDSALESSLVRVPCEIAPGRTRVLVRLCCSVPGRTVLSGVELDFGRIRFLVRQSRSCATFGLDVVPAPVVPPPHSSAQASDASNSGIIDAPSAQLPVWNIYVSLAPLQLAGPITVGALTQATFTLHPPSPDAIGTRRMRFHLPPSTDWLMHGCAAGLTCSLPKDMDNALVFKCVLVPLRAGARKRRVFSNPETRLFLNRGARAHRLFAPARFAARMAGGASGGERVRIEAAAIHMDSLRSVRLQFSSYRAALASGRKPVLGGFRCRLTRRRHSCEYVSPGLNSRPTK